MQNWLRQLLRKLGSNWASVALMFGIFWGGYEVGCRHEENKKNLEHQRIESEQQERQQSEVFEFVWGKNLETARQINRPLSKLTRDVLQQVGVIPEEDAEQ